MISPNLSGLTGCELLRGLVFGGKSNSEIQSSLNAQSATPESFQRLAFELTGLTVPEETARAVFKSLATHLQDLRRVLKRPIGVRTAALDLSDRLERTKPSTTPSGPGGTRRAFPGRRLQLSFRSVRPRPRPTTVCMSWEISTDGIERLSP